jgi:hypothetical protein
VTRRRSVQSHDNASLERSPPRLGRVTFGAGAQPAPFFARPTERTLLSPTDRAHPVSDLWHCQGRGGARTVHTHDNPTDNHLRACPSLASLDTMAPGAARGPGDRSAARLAPRENSTLYTRTIVVNPMDTRRRKDISRRSRSFHHNGCWYGRLVRSLGPCAASSNRDQKRNPN